jgi:hypothetical protein
MIRFVCECGKQLQAREENAGQQAICPGCGRRQLIPSASAEAVRPADAAQPPAQSEARVQRARPTLSAQDEEEAADAQDVGLSGKATTSLVLGIASLFCNVLTGLPALIVGILALRDIGRSRKRLSGHGLAVAGIATACIGTLLSCMVFGMLLLPALLLPAVQKVREAATRVQSQNNLKMMSLAMHNYHNTYGRFPAAAICAKNGKPLLSWRVALLPYLEQQQLYSQFKLDEPWDSPNNSKLLPLMPQVYKLPADTTTPADQTYYQVFVGNGAAFEKTRGLKIPDFLDGISNTILIVEAGQSVPWTKPDDLPYDPNRPLPPLGGHFANGFNAASADGAVHFVPKDTPENTLRLLITRNDGRPVSFP